MATKVQDSLNRALVKLGIKSGKDVGTSATTAPEQKSSEESKQSEEWTYEKIKEKELDYQRKVKEKIPHVERQLACTPEYQVKFSDEIMLAVQFEGAEKLRLVPRLRRAITDPEDVIVRITSTTICGSDLHMYYDKVPDTHSMLPGDILGHEGMGVVDEVGPAVKNFKKGDRVVIGAAITCGNCQYCKSKRPTLCENTNPSKRMEELYGMRLSGILGYSQLTGGYSGAQAEYVRVPLGDNNLLKVPEGMRDEQVLLLSDVCCTGWHCNEMGATGPDDVVCVWGLGPIGLMACYLAKTLRKCKRVIAVENQQFRLDAAARMGVEVIDFTKQDVYETLMKMTNGKGPDVCIEAAGYRYTKSVMQKVSTKMGMDSSDIINEMIKCCSVGGRISLIGDYFGFTNQLAIGALMEKNINVRGGQVWVQTYWHKLLEHIQNGDIDITPFFTHVRPFKDAVDAYAQFANRTDSPMKIRLVTDFGEEMGQGVSASSSSSVTKQSVTQQAK